MGIVELIWEQEISAPGTYTVLPSGKVELILPLHPIERLEAIRIASRDNPVNNHSCFLSGLHTKPLKMTFQRFHAFGVQMKPVAVKALFGLPLCEIRDYFVEGSVVLNPIRIVEEQINSSGGFLERAHWFENFLLKKINETADLYHAIHLNKAIIKYSKQKQHGSSKTIQDIMGYSRTHTFRLFNEWFGISAHSYLQLIQFVRTVETLHNSDLKLNDVGLDNGDFDQSHFIHTFQAFANMTPGEYNKKMSPVPGQIFGW